MTTWFGSAVDGGDLTLDANYIQGCTFTAPASGTVSTARAMIAGGTVARFLIYADTAGSPGALLGRSDELTVGGAKSLRTFTFPAPITVASGTSYFLMLHPASDLTAVYTTGALKFRAQTYPTAPDPFGTASSASGFLLYVEAGIDAAGATSTKAGHASVAGVGRGAAQKIVPPATYTKAGRGVAGLVARGATPAGPTPSGRLLIAFDAATLDPDPDWTRIDSTPNLVVSYTIDRGRQYELDRSDVGRATVQITDIDGVLDPTNTSGPYYGLLEPLLQVVIRRQDPVTGTWYTRYRGFIEDYNYSYDPSQQVNRLELSLVDIFEVLAAVQMVPGEFGDTPPAGSEGQVFFDNATMQDRIHQVLANASIPIEFFVVFTGNVRLYEATYSAAESVMTCIQEAVDAEFPGVGNIYTDRLGRLAVHGRLSKWFPADVAAGATPGAWDFHEWKAGDGAAVNVSPTDTAHIRRFAFNRGLSKIINQALATPVGIADADVPGQILQGLISIGRYGIRAWSAQNLLTMEGLLDDADALTETKRFSEYYINNYGVARNRITDIQFRSINPDHPGGAATWAFLNQVDISDQVDVTVGGSGGGGFTAEPFFVEGIHEQVQPLNPDYDDVTVTLDLSPKAYYTTNPFPES